MGRGCLGTGATCFVEDFAHLWYVFHFLCLERNLKFYDLLDKILWHPVFRQLVLLTDISYGVNVNGVLLF